MDLTFKIKRKYMVIDFFIAVFLMYIVIEKAVFAKKNKLKYVIEGPLVF